MRKSGLLLAGICLAFSAGGCAVKPVPTKGVLTVAGKPLAGATVMFVAEEVGGTNATGFTDAQGKFDLTTFKRNDGALPGSYKVTIVHAEPTEIPPGLKTPEEIQQAMARAPVKASIVPEIYSRTDQTPLRHRVPEDGEAKLDVPRVP